MNKPTEYWISNLGLKQHPEGGYYRETYRSDEFIPVKRLPSEFPVCRSVSTAIYFLLPSNHISHFHRIKSDELWHFHAGTSLTISMLDDGKLEEYKLGLDIAAGEQPQVVIRANVWFGAKVNHGASYTLASCTVAPGFDFQDFEMAKRDNLLKNFPECEQRILELTR